MSQCSECGAPNVSGYHTRPDNLAACTGPKAVEEPKAEPKTDKPARKPRTKK